MSHSALEQDAILDTILGADLDERGDDDTIGNDLDLAIEEMTDDERRIRRNNNLDAVERLICAARGVVRDCRDAVARGGWMVPEVHAIALTSLDTALKKVDRIRELDE